MPKITSAPYTIAGEKCKVDISYNSKEMFHISAGLPAHFVQVANTRQLREMPTEALLIAKLRELIHEYEKTLQTERLVLLVEGSIGKEVNVALNIGYKSEHPLAATYDSPPNFGFNLKFGIANEYLTGSKTEYRAVLKSDNPTIKALCDNGRYVSVGPRTIVMEYTEERAIFLLKFQQNTAELCDRLMQFFTKDEDKMIERVDNALIGAGNQLLLLEQS